jgi:hypothetical protein
MCVHVILNQLLSSVLRFLYGLIRQPIQLPKPICLRKTTYKKANGLTGPDSMYVLWQFIQLFRLSFSLFGTYCLSPLLPSGKSLLAAWNGLCSILAVFGSQVEEDEQKKGVCKDCAKESRHQHQYGHLCAGCMKEQVWEGLTL